MGVSVRSEPLFLIIVSACVLVSVLHMHRCCTRIVTIGPLVPLCFLGITFFVGSRPARRSPETPELSRTASTRGETDASAAGGTSREDSERDEEGEEKRTSSLFFLRPSVRRVLRVGPGNHSTPDQVI